MKELNRRDFLRVSLASAAVAAPASVSFAMNPNELPKQWDETCDVAVVGTGFAGLAAAIEAAKAGAKVTVLEKMPTIGGNSIINGGILAAPGCPQQKSKGIKDSPELLFNDMMTAGAHLNDPAKVRYIAENALATYEWTVNELGVEYLPNYVGQEGGHSVPRYVFTKNSSGSGIINKQIDKLKEYGVKPRVRTFVERIYRDPQSGRILGLGVRERYRFPKADSGVVKTIRTLKGVVLAHGGFSADVKFRTLHDPRLTEQLPTTNQPGATGEMWREASRIGAAVIQQDWIQCTPFCNPREKGLGIVWAFSQSGGAEFGMWVNSNGERFVSELANRKVRADKIFEQHAKNMKAFAICSTESLASLKAARPGYMEEVVGRKLVDKYDTLEALAAANKINYKNLQKTLARVNESAATKQDKDFGRMINPNFQPMKTGPWYVAEVLPKVHHCMGGLATDTYGRVLDIMTQEPIVGLYGAGEAAGGVHGAVRLGSCAILDCLVMGRVCGQHIAKL